MTSDPRATRRNAPDSTDAPDPSPAPSLLEYRRRSSSSRWTPQRFAFLLAACVFAWAIVATGCLCVGSTGDLGWPATKFVRDARLERVWLATLVGVGLATAGLVYQSVLRNPLAEPYLLGVSAGASLAAFTWRMPAVAAAVPPLVAGLGQPAAAFAGAIVATLIVLGIAGVRGRLDPAVLVLVGVIVTTIAASLLLLLHTLSRSMPGSGSFQALLIGDLQTNLTPAELRVATTLVAVGWAWVAFAGGRLAGLSLTDEEASSVGLRVQRERWALLAVASLTTAAAVAVSGPIGFVGLIAPHVARLLVGPDPRRLILAAPTLGAVLLCVGDAASRWLAGTRVVNTILPLGVLTSLIGGPLFVALLLRSHRRESQ